MYLAKSNLMQDALASQQLSTEANDETHHCQTAIPLFGKRGKTEFRVVHALEVHFQQCNGLCHLPVICCDIRYS